MKRLTTRLLMMLMLAGFMFPRILVYGGMRQSPKMIVNVGVRDLNVLGSAWLDSEGRVIGDVRLANDFITLHEKLGAFEFRDRYGRKLYSLDLGAWVLGGSTLKRHFREGSVTVRFYDWLEGEWVIWRRGYGMPDFSHPAFRQAFKWMLSFDGGLNVTFYMTSHDPYVRIIIDSSLPGRLLAGFHPSKMTRMGLEADISNYSRHLLNWNQATSRLHGNPWAPPAWSDTAQGFIGQVFIMQPSSGVEMRKVTDYHQDLNRFIQGHAYDFFNWEENRSENWYSFEFYIRNGMDHAQDVILENYVPDDVYMVEVAFFDGRRYVPVGAWRSGNFSSKAHFTDPLGYEHYFAVHAPVSMGGEAASGLEASSHHGVAGRVLMELNLSGGYVNSPDVYGGSQLRLRLRFHYGDPGYATYLFSSDHHSKYGLANALSPYFLLYNGSIDDRPLFISANLTESLLYIRSDDDEVIGEVGFNIGFPRTSSFHFSLGYCGDADTRRDDDSDGIPDIFESGAFQWSGEDLAAASRASLTYYDIASWEAKDLGGDIVENNARLDWHGGGAGLFGVGTPHGWVLESEASAPIVREIDGYQHILIRPGGEVSFTTSYEVRKTYVSRFNFDRETSTLNLTITYETKTGRPYEGYTVTIIRGLVRRIFRADEVPEGPRSMPDLSYWRAAVLRNGVDDAGHWLIDLAGDLLIRRDVFSSVTYLIRVTINPTVDVDIDYDGIIGVNNLEVSFDFGYRWDSYFNQAGAMEKARSAGFKMARRHLWTLYKGIRYPPSPCVGWNPANHESEGYDWSMLDYWIRGVVDDWGVTPLMSIGGPKPHSIPRNMPRVDLGNGFILPAAADFARFFADVALHIVVDLNVSPIYLEVMNEPVLPDEAAALMYIDLYNAVREKVAEALSPYNKSLGRDVFLGINYIDRFTNFERPFFDLVINGVEGLEFASVHIYPGGWGHPFSPWADNPRGIFYPPNNRHGWFTDEAAINRTYRYTYMHGRDARVSFHEMKARWREKFGRDLILMVTEANLNSAWEGGTDPRQQNLISAVVHAIMLKNYALNNFSQYFFFQLASMRGPKSPTYKYGGFGLAIMNSTPPNQPFAPYHVAYLWGNHMDRGARILNRSISDPGLVDILPTKTGDGYTVWIINKVDSSVTIRLNPPPGIYQVEMHMLDAESYQQRYDPELDTVVFGRREIRTVKPHFSRPLEIRLNGYSVAVLKFKPETPTQTFMRLINLLIEILKHLLRLLGAFSGRASSVD